MTSGIRQTSRRWSIPALLTLVLTLGVAACADQTASKQTETRPDPTEALQGETIERKTELGPVTAVVKVAPPNPTLGDPIILMLEVTAEPMVTVEMPDFGEALGRFSIARFVPRESTVDGKRVATQVYTLQAPMSGKQRIPPLRIEFIDERNKGAAATPAAAPPAAAPADADSNDIRELLTEEIAIEVASLLAEELTETELAGPRENLRVPSPANSIFASVWFWLPVGLLLSALLYFGVGKFLAQARKQRRISAYASAMKRLGKLESRGLPEPETADNWYVELSGIIRRYLEDRYNLRAPELTTEEFLKIARSSGVLSSEHRKLLQTFLTRCDRVKFARYAPEDEESRETLTSAKSFLEDTRLEAQARLLAQEKEAAA